MLTSLHVDAPPDVLILGGGPAGSAAAIELAHSGRRVTLLERTLTAHDKVCGDFLSAEAVSSLQALGIDATSLGAVPIHNVRLAGPLGLAESRLPFAAQSLTRRTLDEALLLRASAAGARVLRGHTAESLYRTDSHWRVHVSGPSNSYNLTAPHLLLATGKHDLRGLPRPSGPQPDLVGLKMYLRLAPDQAAAIRDTIELILISGRLSRPLGYGGLSLVEDPSGNRAGSTVANLCFVIQRKQLRTLGRDWHAISALLTRNPHLRTRLAGSEPLLARPLAINPIPYGMLLRHAIAADLFAIGDQTAVIPSLTGDGLALALHSGRFAAQSLLAGHSSHRFHAELHAQLRPQLRLATIVSRAFVAEPQRSIITLAARLFPGLLRRVASHTRIATSHQLPPRNLTPRENTCTAA